MSGLLYIYYLGHNLKTELLNSARLKVFYSGLVDHLNIGLLKSGMHSDTNCSYLITYNRGFYLSQKGGRRLPVPLDSDVEKADELLDVRPSTRASQTRR